MSKPDYHDNNLLNLFLTLDLSEEIALMTLIMCAVSIVSQAVR